jgi:hypothetical protein
VHVVGAGNLVPATTALVPATTAETALPRQ